MPIKRAVKVGLIVLGAVAALAAGFTLSHWLRAPATQEGEAALVDFALPDLDGKERWLSEWQGKIIVLNFWATWCAPCKEEMPLLMDLHKRYYDQGVRVVGVAIDTRDAVAAYAKELGINYPLLIGDDAGLSLMTRYGNPRGGLPYTVVIGPEGKVTAKKLGAYKGNQLTIEIGPLVKAESTSTMPK